MLLDISVTGRSRKKKAEEFPIGHVFRRFEDGTLEVQVGKNRRLRTRIFECGECGDRKIAREFITHINVEMFREEVMSLCRECWEAENRRRHERARMETLIARIEAGETSPQRRAAQIAAATPRWRDRDAIRAIYDEARRLTQETGIPHDVDHIHPIMGAFSCGLHVHWNLRVLKATENRAKGAKFDFSESPAWDGMTASEIAEEYKCMRWDLQDYDAMCA